MTSTSGKPKYLQLTDKLRRQIARGEFKPGDRLPSFAEMGAEHGLGTATLTRVYALLRQEGLIVSEQGRGTFVCERPARPATGTIGLVGLDSLSAEVPYFGHLLQGIREAAGRLGMEILLLDEGRQGAGGNAIDGVIVCCGGARPPQSIALGTPWVSLIFTSPGTPSVIANDYAGAKAATEHLLELGHRRIAFMAPSLGGGPSAHRLAGYQAALWEAGIEPDPALCRTLRNGWGNLTGYDRVGQFQMAEWLREDWPELGCTALLSANDEMAIGIIGALRDAGIGVPDEVSVVGFDGTRVGEYSHPKLTSVQVPLREIGARGVDLLVQQIRGDKAPDSATVLPVGLLVRESTAKKGVPKQ